MSLLGKNLSFKYEDKEIFKNFNIEVKKGELVGLQGYSGSGKTTLGKILAGYIQESDGQVLIDGVKKEKYLKSFYPVQIVHQHPEKSLNNRWKMKDVLDESNLDKKYLMDLFGIREEWLDRWPIELSGGELQRFCIARAFHKDTKYIIADEITTMLDAITQAKFWKKIVKICRQRDIGLLMISHEKDLIDKICDRKVYMETL